MKTKRAVNLNKGWLTVLFVLMVVVVLSGCGEKSALAGQWKLNGENSAYSLDEILDRSGLNPIEVRVNEKDNKNGIIAAGEEDTPLEVVLNRNGTGTVDGDAVTWTAKKVESSKYTDWERKNKCYPLILQITQVGQDEQSGEEYRCIVIDKTNRVFLIMNREAYTEMNVADSGVYTEMSAKLTIRKAIWYGGFPALGVVLGAVAVITWGTKKKREEGIKARREEEKI